MTKTPLVVGLMLYGITMLAFFVVYYFFANINYYHTSSVINAFIMPFLYSIGAFLSVYWYRGKGKITYPQAFKQSFTNLFVGGSLSLLSIFAFLNYVDTDARDMLNKQYIQLELYKLDQSYAQQRKEALHLKDPQKVIALDENYKKMKEARLEALKENRNYFSFSFISAIFGGFVLFYLLLSIVIAAFLKNKKRYE
ncbi:DUF4199 family protein [Elizabethkingia argentiflava]|uniref:DUF4199 family protein n=1 Tax=Elizabethkingia argenteiflava TaxID=2681556 RepID=A0A845PY27_9FLAO|nr:DUF4199 domain-containing protein [Elizabethkingia argenteiflava]NAW50980.1 DUF4199 family protein [Elizabethkingia argenteiflava]